MYNYKCYICEQYIILYNDSVSIEHYSPKGTYVWGKHAHIDCFKQIRCVLKNIPFKNSYLENNYCDYCHNKMKKNESYSVIDYKNDINSGAFYLYHDSCFQVMVDEKTSAKPLSKNTAK